jgi:hypothetical protein
VRPIRFIRITTATVVCSCAKLVLKLWKTVSVEDL